MGINKLHDFLKKKVPHLYQQVSLSQYAGQRVAVDISGLIYKYKILNKQKWLSSFAYLVFALRRNRIHPIFVYEGDPPPEKKMEIYRRGKQRNQLKEKAAALRESLDHYYETQEIKDNLVDEMKKRTQVTALGSVVPISTNILEERYEQLHSQLVYFEESELDDLNRLFDLAGVQYAFSPSEAETLCCSLAKEGKVDAVISNDSDVMAHGVSKFLYDINGLTETCTAIDYQTILKGMEMSREQFTDFCIMSGCDYNENLKGIGPVNAYRLLKEFGSIEQLPKQYDTSNHEVVVEVDIMDRKQEVKVTKGLNYKRCRELFAVHHPFPDRILSKAPEEIDLDKLYNFLQLKNCRIKMETIQKAFQPVEIVFGD